MCRKRIDVPPTTRGFEQPQVIRHLLHRRRIFFFVLPFMILATLPRGQARASDTPDNRRLIRNGQVHNAHPENSRLNGKEDWQEEDIYVGRSGDPWGTASIKQKEENVYTSVSPFANSTYNETNSQLPANEEKSFTRTRFKRGVIHLYNMVVCATGCNPLVYKGYGCYCGFLGSGYVIDGIDRCCKMHDWCYDATECPMFSEYFVPYYWRCYHGYKPVCAVEHGNWGGSGSCSQRLCECDRSLAECLRRYPCPRTKAVCTSSPWRLVQNLFMIM